MVDVSFPFRATIAGRVDCVRYLFSDGVEVERSVYPTGFVEFRLSGVGYPSFGLALSPDEFAKTDYAELIGKLREGGENDTI